MTGDGLAPRAGFEPATRSRITRVSHGWQPCILSAGSREPRTGLYYLYALHIPGIGREPGILVLGKATPEKLASLNLPKETKGQSRITARYLIRFRQG